MKLTSPMLFLSATATARRHAPTATITAVATLVVAPALAHHGLGRFDRTKPVEIEGTIKSIDFVNPHSYLNLDVIGAEGSVIAMRCEMRAAPLLRRPGWSEEMFVAGARARS